MAGKKASKGKKLTEKNLLQQPRSTIKRSKKYRLAIGQLKRNSDPSTLPLTTAFANTPTLGLGQERALQAFDTALGIEADGYNILAVGETGLGKRKFITDYLGAYYPQQEAANGSNDRHTIRPALEQQDWCYVHNFNNPTTPIALSLPAGHASTLAKDVLCLWQHVQENLQQQFHNAAYQEQIKTLNAVSSSPINDARASIERLQHTLARQAISPLFAEYLENYLSLKDVYNYLQLMQQDMIMNASLIANKEDTRSSRSAFWELSGRYMVNIVVSRKPTQAPPIVFTGSYINLLGHIEQRLYHGTLSSDVSMIKSGALHHANGGFLILEARQLLKNPDIWQDLKQALQSKKIGLPRFNQQKTLHNQSFCSSTLITPDPIALRVKVIILSDPNLYEELRVLEDFDTIFRIRADFEVDIQRNAANEQAMAAKMADMIAAHHLHPFNAQAQARLLEQLSLQAEEQHKLSLHSDSLLQLLIESNHKAVIDFTQENSHIEGSGVERQPHSAHIAVNSDIDDINIDINSIVGKKHVESAIADRDYRTSYLRDLYWQDLKNGQQLISIQGSAIGQINALTVIEYINSEFGMPARLTAVVQHNLGSGEVLDIESDVELGGNLHTKGMLIMNSYLRALFSPYHALNFTASIAFEQSYAEIDGDSATVAEACALLSALADTPFKQSLAVTGSMNQLGQVQAVGGINAKVAGFYDTCCQQGLTGDQGVILPAVNINELMLRDDIISAVAANKFHIYAVNTLSEALAILANMPIDEKTKSGNHRQRSLFGRIIKRLEAWDDEDNKETADDSTNKQTST